MRLSVYAVAAAGLAVAAVFFLGREAPRPPETRADAPAGNAVKIAASTGYKDGAGVAGCNLPGFPFCPGGPPALPPQAERIEARRVVMKSLGIETPPEYYDLSFAELNRLAERNNIFALLQLAVQYKTEIQYIEREPAYDPKINPPGEYRALLGRAVAAGHVRSAALLAQDFLAGGNQAEAYAWYLLGSRLGDPSAADWANKAFSGISYADRARAEERYASLYQLAVKRLAQN